MIFKQTLQTKNVWKWKNTCEMVVLHHTWTTPWTTQWNLNVLLWKTPKIVSAHYLINEVWEVYKLAQDEQITYHAWSSSWNWKTDLNKYSIWIEIVWPWFSDIQRDKVDELVMELISKHNIKKENIVRHKDIAPGRKIDPDDSLWLTRFKTFEAYKNFLFSKLTIMETVWFYEEIYKKENPNGWSIIKDIDWAINRLVDSNWNLKWKETIYFFWVIAERLDKKIIK